MWRQIQELEERFRELEQKNILTDKEYEEIQNIYDELSKYNQY